MTTRRRKKHRREEIVAKLRDADAMLDAGKDLVIRRRLAALRRQEIIAEVLQAEAELNQAGGAPRSADEVMRDITS